MRTLLPALLLAACDVADVSDTPDDVARACDPSALGHTPLRRLSNRELRNTVRDLLGPEAVDVVDPVVDDSYQGFDNVALVQATSLLHVERYQETAKALAGLVVARAPAVQVIELEDLALEVGEPLSLALGDAAWWAFVGQTEDRAALPLAPPAAGRYRLTVRAVWAIGWTGRAEVLPAIGLTLGDGAELPAQDVTGVHDQAVDLVFEAELPQGPQTLTLRLERMLYTYGVAVDHVVVEGPLDDPRALDGPVRRRWLTCDPARDGERACAEAVLGELAPRAWRRPLTDEERAGLEGIVADALADGADVDAALATALEALFLSPSFLYRVELDGGGPRPPDPWEAASRLSYLVWGSLPDDTLRGCAAAGGLRRDTPEDDPCSAPSQVERMLADPRADTLATELAAQWLQLGRLDGVEHPTVDRAALRGETERVLLDALADETDLRDLLRADETWVDPALAALYGLGPVDGWTRAALPPDRVGLLGHASILTLTSTPTRTSPVKRGLWVLARLLCDEPEPPPPGIPALEELPGSTVPEQLEAHRADPACAGCHATMDPVGLALERFGPDGGLREAWPDGAAVDPRATLPDGTALDDHVDLAAWVAAHPDVGRCVVRHLATSALGRPIEADGDACVVDEVAAAPVLSLRGVVRALVASEAFWTVRGAPGEAP